MGLSTLSISGPNVTLYEIEGGTNFIASDGAVEILTIDTAGKVVSGRIDARYDNNSYVNGNFTATWCD